MTPEHQCGILAAAVSGESLAGLHQRLDDVTGGDGGAPSVGSRSLRPSAGNPEAQDPADLGVNDSTPTRGPQTTKTMTP